MAGIRPHQPARTGRRARAGWCCCPATAAAASSRVTREQIDRCSRLFLQLEEEFDLCLVDLSAGRSYATEMVLAATAQPALRNVRTGGWSSTAGPASTSSPPPAWSTASGASSTPASGTATTHAELAEALRFVRTAVVDPDSPELEGLRAAQVAWLRDCDRDLAELASGHKVGRTLLLATVPLDPVLQWREQLISDNDVWSRRIANRETLEAFDSLAKKIVDDAAWETL